MKRQSADMKLRTNERNDRDVSQSLSLSPSRRIPHSSAFSFTFIPPRPPPLTERPPLVLQFNIFFISNIFEHISDTHN